MAKDEKDRGKEGKAEAEDDKEETVRKRLRIFHETYGELLEYYRQMGLLREVSGIGDIDVIYANIIKALGLTSGSMP